MANESWGGFFQSYIKTNAVPTKSASKKRGFVWRGNTFYKLEDMLHYECLLILKQYPDVVVVSNHLQGASIGRRNFQALRLKKLLNGTLGLPDVMIMHKSGVYSGLCIELKSISGKLQKNQIECIKKLESQGFLVKVLGAKTDNNTTIQDLRILIEGYLNGN